MDRPNLTKWIARVQAEFSPFYEEAHKVIEQTADEYKRYVNKLSEKN